MKKPFAQRFKLRVLAAAVAVLSCAGGAWAQEAQSASAPKPGPSAREAFASAKAGEWTIKHSPQLAAAVAKVAASGLAGAPLAEAAQAAAREQGLLSVGAKVFKADKVVELTLAPTKVSGDERYSRFFGRSDGVPLEQDDLNASLRLAQTAARFNGEAVDIKMGQPGPDGSIPLEIAGKEVKDAKKWGGVATFSTYGQRYSGRDVATISGWMNLGGGAQLNGSYSEGLSDLRKDSKGGFYHALNLGIDKVLDIGTLSVKFGHTEYKPGGPMAVYDIRGKVTRLDAELDVPISGNLSALVGGGYVLSSTNIRSAGLTGETAFGYASGGARYQGESFQITGKVIQGLGGSEKFNVSPLSGHFDPNFTAFNIEARKGFDLGSGFSLDFAGSAQKATKGTPGPMQIYGGGVDRGRHFHTGNISAPSGYTGGVTLTKKIGDNWAIYGGADGAVLKPEVGDDLRQKSVFIGVKGAAPEKGFSWDASITKAVNPQSPDNKGYGLMVYLNWQF